MRSPPIRQFPLRVALLLAATLPASAQQPEWRLIRPSNTGIPGEQLQFARVAPDDHVWVAGRFPFWGEGGIAEFDGTRWSTYANVDTPQPSQWVLDAAFGPGGVNWYATLDGLVRHAGDDWQVYDASNSPLPTGEVYRVAVGADGAVWTRHAKNAAVGDAVGRFDGTTWTIWKPEDIGLDALSDLWGPVVDKDGAVWVSSNAHLQPGSGLARYDGSGWTVFDASTGQSDTVPHHLTVDDAGNLWLGWWKGVMRWDGTSFVDMPDPPLTESWSAFRARGVDDYWVGGYSGKLVHWNGSGWSQLLEDGQPLVSWVLSIDFTSDGTLWVGTLNAGLKRFDFGSGQWTTFNHRNTGLPSYFVEGFAADAQGDMWIACAGAGVAEMTGTAGDFHAATWRDFNAGNAGAEPWPWSFDMPWGNDSAVDVVADDLGGVWVASTGVGRWDGESWELFVPQTSGISGSAAEHLGWNPVDRELWVGFYQSGVDRYDGAAWTH